MTLLDPDHVAWIVHVGCQGAQLDSLVVGCFG